MTQITNPKTIAVGAMRSKTVWVNVTLAVLATIELQSSHLSELFGVRAMAAIVFFGSLVNVALRAYTAESLTEKAAKG